MVDAGPESPPHHPTPMLHFFWFLPTHGDGRALTALVGDTETVAARLREYAALGIDTFILSGYPHLEEAYRVAELLLPRLGAPPIASALGR